MADQVVEKELEKTVLAFACKHCKFPLNAREDAATAALDGTCKMCHERWTKTGRTPVDDQEWQEYLSVRKLKWLNYPVIPEI